MAVGISLPPATRHLHKLYLYLVKLAPLIDLSDRHIQYSITAFSKSQIFLLTRYYYLWFFLPFHITFLLTAYYISFDGPGPRLFRAPLPKEFKVVAGSKNSFITERIASRQHISIRLYSIPYLLTLGQRDKCTRIFTNAINYEAKQRRWWRWPVMVVSPYGLGWVGKTMERTKKMKAISHALGKKSVWNMKKIYINNTHRQPAR